MCAADSCSASSSAIHTYTSAIHTSGHTGRARTALERESGREREGERAGEEEEEEEEEEESLFRADAVN